MSLHDVVRELIERVDWHGNDGAKEAATAAVDADQNPEPETVPADAPKA